MREARRSAKVPREEPKAILALGLALAALLSACSDDRETDAATAFDAGVRAALAHTDGLVSRSAHFDQESVLAGLAPNRRSGFHYRFDDRWREAEISVGAGARPEPASAHVLLPRTSPYTRERRDGREVVALELLPGDVLETPTPLGIPVDEVAEFELEVGTSEFESIELGWAHSDEADPGRRGQRRSHSDIGWTRIDLVADGRLHTYRVNAHTALQRDRHPGDLRRLFLRARGGGALEVGPVRLVGPGEIYGREPVGRDYVELGGEMRRVLYARTPASLRYRLPEVEGPLALRTGLAMPRGSGTAEFRVVYRDAAGERELLRQRVEGDDRWTDLEVSLPANRSGPFEIALTAEGPEGAVGFWSNPLVYGPRAEPFNIVMIVQDTLRADRLSAYGHTRPTSPHTDALAARGVLFENAFSQATMTRPSAASMMTGLYPTAAGVWGFRDVLSERYLTLAEVLRSQGFATAAFVGNPNAGPYAGVQQGFSVLVHRFGGRAREPGERFLVQTAEDILAERLFEWLAENRDRNFFLYLHLVDPHAAYDAPAPYDAWYREAPSAGTPVAPDPGLDPKGVSHPTDEGRRRLYDGEVRYNDEQIGRFLARLEADGLLDDTLVVMTSDHGEFLGDRDPELWRHRPPGYREVLHVPLILHYPDRLPQGERVSTNVQLIDLFPTLMELAEIERSQFLLQGESLLPVIAGTQGDRIAISDEVVGRDRSERQPWGSVFFRGRHYLDSRTFGATTGSPTGPRAFDWRRDPGERVDLVPAGDAPLQPRASRFLGDLVARNARIRENLRAPAKGPIELDSEVQEQLRGLGYVDPSEGAR